MSRKKDKSSIIITTYADIRDIAGALQILQMNHINTRSLSSVVANAISLLCDTYNRNGYDIKPDIKQALSTLTTAGLMGKKDLSRYIEIDINKLPDLLPLEDSPTQNAPNQINLNKNKEEKNNEV